MAYAHVLCKYRRSAGPGARVGPAPRELPDPVLDRDHLLPSLLARVRRWAYKTATQICYLPTLIRITRTRPLASRTLSPLTRNRCVSVGTRKGYSITNCDPFGRVYTMSLCCPVPQLAIADCAPDDGARGIVEMLFCTSLIALVGAADQPQSSPRKLQIVNTKVASLLHAFQSLRLTHRPPATIHDLRAALSVLHPCSQTEPQNARHRAGGRNLHLRHIQHALTPCHRNVAEPRWCV